MAQSRGLVVTYFLIGMLLVTTFFQECIWAGPVQHPEDAGDTASEGSSTKLATSSKLARNKRSAGPADFWAWYKFFMDSGNQEGVKDLDHVYVAYLQNKHRLDEDHSFNHYLHHLRAIYKFCAESDDPDCITEYTSKPKAQVVMPKTVPAAACNPYTDPYCLFTSASSKVPVIEPTTAAPVKAFLPMLTPVLPLTAKAPLSYYSAPVLQPFLSPQQHEELLRICNPSDTDCLQYHLRAAYGYTPTTEPLPSYSHLGCDPSKDPYCRPKLVQKAQTGLYHLYPTCNPDYDPFCTPPVPAPAPQTSRTPEEPPKVQSCNPIFDENCNPLTAMTLSSLTKPVLEYTPRDEHGPSPVCNPQYDPYCLLGVPAAIRTLAQYRDHPHHRLGIRGKTKEGYDCYMFYDKECHPLDIHSNTKLEAPAGYTGGGSKPDCHPYDPICWRFSPPPASATKTDKPGESGVIQPDPDCDPEYDYSCRLRHYDPKTDKKAHNKQSMQEPKNEPQHQVQEHATPTFQDFIKRFTILHSRYNSP